MSSSKHGISLVCCGTPLSLNSGCVSCSDETFEQRHLKGLRLSCLC